MSSQVTTATNLQGPDIGNSQNNATGTQNNTAKFFNNYFSGDFTISADKNDAIVAYFEKYTGNATAGQALAATVIYTAQAQNLDPMSVLAQFQSLTQGQINAYLVAFLNFNRVPTSQIGLKTAPTVSPYVARTILP